MSKPVTRRRTFRGLVLSLSLIASWLLFPLPAFTQQEHKRGPHDWIFLIDTSASMVGKGPGAKDIFGKVQETIKRFIQERTIPGDSVDIYQFDEGWVFKKNVRVVNQASKDALKDEIGRLEAKGKYTHTGEAMRTVLARWEELNTAATLSRNPGALDRRPIIVLLTDGLEDIKQGSGARPLSTIQVNQLEVKPYTFFVWLGESTEAFENSSLGQFKDDLGDRGFLLSHPQGQDVEEALTKIGNEVAALPPPVRVHPKSLDFGRVETGKASQTMTINVITEKPTSIRLTLADDDPAVFLDEPRQPVTLESGGEHKIDIRLKVAEGTPDRALAGKILISLDEVILEGAATAAGSTRPPTAQVPAKQEELTFGLEVYHVTWTEWVMQTSLKALGLGFLGIIIVLFACFRLGISIRDKLGELSAGSFLTGGFSISKPHAEDEDRAFVDLEGLNTDKINLSAIEQIKEMVGESDAELSVASRGKAKGVQLHYLKGEVSVNDVPATTIFLADGDVVGVGQAQLIFRDSTKP